MEALKKYLKRNNLRPTPWAKEHGIAPPVVSRYLNGKMGLSPKNAARISEATGREVTETDLLYPGRENAA